MRGAPIRAIVLILLLAAACAQCVAQCADTGRGVPPCHKQQQPKSSVLCQTPVLAMKDTPAAIPVDIVIGPAPVLDEIHELVAHESSRTATPPPLLSPILRI